MNLFFKDKIPNNWWKSLYVGFVLIILKISDFIFGLTYPWSTLICFRVECTTAYKYFQDIGYKKDKIMLKNTKKRSTQLLEEREDQNHQNKPQTTAQLTDKWQNRTLTQKQTQWHLVMVNIIENIDFRQKKINHLHKRTFCCLLSQSCLTLSLICSFI